MPKIVITDDEGTSVVVEVVKIDRNTLKGLRFELSVPCIAPYDDEVVLKTIKVNVGDFVILPNGHVYRRIRGGWRKATDDDMAELVAIEISDSI